MTLFEIFFVRNVPNRENKSTRILNLQGYAFQSTYSINLHLKAFQHYQHFRNIWTDYNIMCFSNDILKVWKISDPLSILIHFVNSPKMPKYICTIWSSMFQVLIRY